MRINNFNKQTQQRVGFQGAVLIDGEFNNKNILELAETICEVTPRGLVTVIKEDKNAFSLIPTVATEKTGVLKFAGILENIDNNATVQQIKKAIGKYAGQFNKN